MTTLVTPSLFTGVSPPPPKEDIVLCPPAVASSSVVSSPSPPPSPPSPPSPPPSPPPRRPSPRPSPRQHGEVVVHEDAGVAPKPTSAGILILNLYLLPPLNVMTRLCTPLRTANREEDEALDVEGREAGKASKEGWRGARAEVEESEEEEERRIVRGRCRHRK